MRPGPALTVCSPAGRTPRFARMLSSKLTERAMDFVYIAHLDEKNQSIGSVAGMCGKAIKA